MELTAKFKEIQHAGKMGESFGNFQVVSRYSRHTSFDSKGCHFIKRE